MENLSTYPYELWRIEEASTQAAAGKMHLIFFIRDDGFFNMQSTLAGVVMAVAGRASGLAAEGKNGADSEKYGIDF